MPSPEFPKEYLEYLDKEMTIMGILSTFCVAAASLIVDRVASADHDNLFKKLYDTAPAEIMIGSGFLMLAGLFFYLQRSWLAHLYGSTCMSFTRPGHHDWDTDRWLLEAFSWPTWFRYRAAFSCLEVTAVMYGHSLYRARWSPQNGHWIWFSLGLVLIVILAGFQAFVLMKYRFQPRPYYQWWHVLRDDWSFDERSLGPRNRKAKRTRVEASIPETYGDL